jgi:uroporphyrinogen III methyltransferase/synthase
MKRILITRPRAQAGAFAAGLKAAGFTPVFFPVIEIRPMEDTTALERALTELASYDWIVFTSVNGVDAVFDRPKTDPTKLAASLRQAGIKSAAIGPKTAEALRRLGIEPDFIPAEYVAEAILPGLGDLHGRRVLLPRAEIARKALPEAIRRAGGSVDEIAVYRTLPAKPGRAGLAALRAGVDVVTLTSPSTVQNFVAIVRRAGLDPLKLPAHPLIACIGPITRRAAEDEGLPGLIAAKEYTTDGLIRAIRKALTV